MVTRGPEDNRIVIPMEHAITPVHSVEHLLLVISGIPPFAIAWVDPT